MKEQHKEFLEKISANFITSQSELVHITEALGRVISSDIRAKYTSPHKDMSAINGYAVICDGTTKFKIAGHSTASVPFSEEISPGQAVKVTSGSVLPIGTDTVISEQDVKKQGNYISTDDSIIKGQNICYTGVDFLRNEPVLKAGSVISARDIGLAASMKVPWIPVSRKPNIAVFAVGDELSMIGDLEGEVGKTSSSSSLIISSFVKACGANSVDMGVAKDSTASIQKLIENSKGVDLIITTGGLSASADDLMKKSLDKTSNIVETELELSGTIKVLFAKKGGTPILCLPGHPISAQICATLFVRPLINKMTNMCKEFYKKSSAVLDRDLDVNDKQMDYIFSKLSENDEKRLKVMPASSYDRLLMSALGKSDCLIKVDHENAKKGDNVLITRFTCSIIDG